MARHMRSSLAVQGVKGAFFLLVGVVLIAQPWLAGVAWLGWCIVAVTALIAAATLARVGSAARMQRRVVARFACGDAVYEKGLRAGGALYDFSTPGAQLTAADFDGEKLTFYYSFYARRGGRASQSVCIPVAPEEAALAREALAHLGLPEPAEHEKEEA